MSSSVSQKLNELGKLCEKFSVKQLDIFGSAAEEKGMLPDTSDIDFLVEFLPLGEDQYADTYFGLLFALEELFNRKIDLVMVSAIKNPYFRESVERSRKSLYAA
ncbi:MAG: nucleotidyltransferase domain-containing protein [bacterium]|nr:nucleotidyltransferase domain-containing protein [bacterium]MDT8396225.1 nucleotidyltransferase domain-containing protein [bacterium]